MRMVRDGEHGRLDQFILWEGGGKEALSPEIANTCLKRPGLSCL